MGPLQRAQAPSSAATRPAAPGTAPAPDVTTRAAAFENSRLQLIQKSLFLPRVGAPLLALISGALFTIWTDARIVAAWVIAYVVVNYIAVNAISGMSADGKEAGPAQRKIVYVGLLFACCNAVWAAMPLLFWVRGSFSNHLLIIVLLSTAVPYAIATTGASLRSYSISVIPLAIALVATPLLAGGAIYDGIAALGALYCSLMLAVAWQQHSTMTSMLQIKENNSELLVQVAKAKAESDAARYRAERLNQAKSTFLANMSHELRTPLNAILGFSEVIHNEMLGPIGTITYKDYAGDIHSSGRHLLGLINDILDLSRIEAGRVDLAPAVLSVEELVGDTIRITEGTATKNGVMLVRKIPDGLPHIRVDERAMRQVLLNLLSNAIKFTPQGGRVTISAEAGSTMFGPKGLTITVEDTGIGIKKEDMSLVLEAFGQVRIEDLAMTAPREQGTGLGLPIVRGLIEAHGGKFVLESEFGVGTKATAHLPRRCVIDPAHMDEELELPRTQPQAKRA